MNEQTDLETPIGDKEIKRLEPKMIKIAGVEIKPIVDKSTGKKVGDKVVLSVIADCLSTAVGFWKEGTLLDAGNPAWLNRFPTRGSNWSLANDLHGIGKP